jgi:hypothetical protein
MRFDSVKEILEVDNNVTGRLVADLYSDLQPLFNPQAYDEVSKEKVKPTPYKLFGIDNTLTLIEKSLLSTFYTLHKNLG